MEEHFRDTSKDKVITLMCDYCADGLWLNGKAIDVEYMITDLGFKKDDLEEIKGLISIWQQMYETFDFYTGETEAATIYASNDYLLFEKLGEHIYYLLKKIPQDKYTIEYFNEKTSKRTRE